MAKTVVAKTVDTLHPRYEEWIDIWEQNRHAFMGARAVKNKDHRTTYLPLLEEQQGPEYADYVDRATWFPATERTVKGMSGAVLRTETQIDGLPSMMEDHLEDITLTGLDLHAFAGKILPEQVLEGRAGGLVEMPEEESPDQRPYWTMWTADKITNWATARIFGRLQLVMVVLKEETLQPEGQFGWVEKPSYRVLELVPVGMGDLRYRVTIWEKRGERGKESWQPVKESWPMRAGVLLDEIPFTFFGASSIEPKVDKPPSLDVVELNIALYRNSADYENALTAIRPMWALAGYPAGTSVVLGPRRAINSEKDAGKVRAQILQGADPDGLRKAMGEKKADLAIAGGRMLEGQPMVNETAQAVKMRHHGDESSLRTVSLTHGRGLTQMLRHHARWMGAPQAEAIQAEPNTDFVSARLNPQEITALQGLLQEGSISYQTFYHLLAEGETARPGVTWEEELEQIRLEEEQDLLQRQKEAEKQAEENERQLFLQQQAGAA